MFSEKDHTPFDRKDAQGFTFGYVCDVRDTAGDVVRCAHTGLHCVLYSDSLRSKTGTLMEGKTNTKGIREAVPTILHISGRLAGPAIQQPEDARDVREDCAAFELHPSIRLKGTSLLLFKHRTWLIPLHSNALDGTGP